MIVKRRPMPPPACAAAPSRSASTNASDIRRRPIVQPRLTRIGPAARSGSTPIASRTCDAPDLARRAGRARRDRDAGEVERHQQPLGRRGPAPRRRCVLGSRARAARRRPRRRARARDSAASNRSRSAASRRSASTARDRRRAAAPKAAMAGDVLGAAAQPALLAAAAHAAARPMATPVARSTRAPTPFGPPSLWRRQQQRHRRRAPRRRQAIRPAAWTASQTTSPPCGLDERRGLGDRLDHAGLVVGGLQRQHGRRRPRDERASQRRRGRATPSASTGSDRRRARPGSGGRAARRHARRRRRAGASSRRRPRRRGRASAPVAASVPPEVKTTPLGPRADQRGDLRARAVSTRPARARPSAWTDDGLPASVQRRDHGGRAPRPQRRRGIVVEIDRAAARPITAIAQKSCIARVSRAKRPLCTQASAVARSPMSGRSTAC